MIRFHSRTTAAFTLVEVMVSMSASIIVLATLIVGSMTLQKSLHITEKSAEAYSDQRRLTDYLSRDLRRAVSIAKTDGAGLRSEVEGSGGTIAIDNLASLILKLPAYYQSNTSSEAGYEAPLEVIGDMRRLDYGGPNGLASPVEITFRKVFHAKERSICFVRQEAGSEEVIVRHAQAFGVEIQINPGAHTCSIKTTYQSPQRRTAPLVTTHDGLLLRNPRLDYRP